MKISLPFPDKVLSPNARAHWATVSKAKKKARHDAGWATIESGAKVDWEGAINVLIEFYPPSKRRYDGDGLLSRMKGALDGIADALQVDDILFEVTIRRMSPVPLGRVDVTITKPVF